MAEFLHDLNIHGAGQIQFKTTAGANAGKIDQNGNDLVLSNAVGDIIIGNGSDDVFIGDGTNAVDIRFEQNMAIFADSSSTKTLTLGGSNTSLILESPTFNGTVTLGATTINNKLTFTSANGYILFDYEPSTGDNAEYSSEVPLLKVDHNGTEKTILSRLTNNAALAIGNDDTVAIVAGDTKSVIKDNHNYTAENVILSSEGGFIAYAFPDNTVTWANRNVFEFRGYSNTAANNGLYIGDGGQTQFIDLSRNLKNIGTISSGAITATDYRSSSHIYLTSGDSWIFRSTGGTEYARFKSNGYLGIGTTNPDEKLHVMYAHADGAPTQYAKAVIEDTDAQLDILSASDGTWGSSINLVEAAGSGANTDVWAIARKTTGGVGDSSLNFNFGTGNLHSNTTRVSFSSTGNITANQLNLDSIGDYITFYGGGETNHSITSRQLDGGTGDDIRVNTYGSFIVNLDSNDNQTSAANSSFFVGRHGSNASAISGTNLLFQIDGQTGDVLPGTDNTHDLGSSSYRWQNVVAVNLHGDGSNITNIGNADTVDNLHASSFLRSDTADTATGKITLEGNSAAWSATTPGLTTGSLHFDPGVGTDHFGNAITFGASDSDNGTTAQAGIYLRTDGSYGSRMYFATTDAYNTGSKVAMYINNNKVVYFLGGINMSNSNISGVNAIQFADPGPSEGLTWTNTKIFESPNDLTTNTSGNLQLVYNNTRRLTVDSGGIDVNGNIVVSGTVDGVDIAALAAANTGDQILPTDFVSAANGGTFSGDIEAPGVYVGSTNTSYDFYNNGTSYLNGAVTIDDDLTVTGNFTITGDLNTVSVTDLDVSDKTITVGVGQTENVSGGSGLKVSGPTTEPSMLWDESNDTWDFNYGIDVAGNITLSGTVDGVDIATRDAVLTTTTNTANAAAPKASPTFTGDITIPNKIIHTGDTNTYMQFEAADVWRVVTGGTERLDINTNRILVGDDMNMNFDGISGGNVDGNNVQQSGNSGTVVYGGFLNPASEANMVHIPHIINDLAGFNRWSNATITTSGFYKTRSGSSGSYTYSNEVQANDSGWANAFDAHSSTAGSWYSDNGSDGVYQHGTDTPGVVELEWTNEATYSLWAGIVFGSGSFTPTYVKIEAYRADAWQTLCEITDNTDQVILRQVSGNSGTNAATRRLKYTLGGSVNNSYFRIHSLYMVNYAAGNLNLNNTGVDTTRGVNFLERYKDGYLHGHLRPGKDDTYDFGSSSYKWKNAYFDGVVTSDRVQSEGVFPQQFIIDTPNGGGNSRTMQIGMSGSSMYFKKSDATGSIIFRNTNNTNLMTIGLADTGQVTVLNELEAGSLDINGNSALGEDASDTTTISGNTILNKKAASGATNISIAQLKTADGSTTWNIGGNNTSYDNFMVWAADKGAGNYFQINKTSGQVKIGADASGSDLYVYGNDTGEGMFWDASESHLTIKHDDGDLGLEIYPVGSTSPTAPQIRIGRDNGQYWGAYVTDSVAHLVHRQDETGGSDHFTKFQIWTNATGSHAWQWDMATNAGASVSTKMKLTDSGVLTLGGGSNTITNAKVANWDSAYTATNAFTTVGTAFTQLSDVSVASYIRINADETLSYLNAAQFLTAIGGVDGSAYLPLAGGTITGDVEFHGSSGSTKMMWDKSDNALEFSDHTYIYLGDSNDGKLFHDGSSTVFDIPSGDILIGDYETFNSASFAFARIGVEAGIYQPEEGWFTVRSNATSNKTFIGSNGGDTLEITDSKMMFYDNKKLNLGSSDDLQIYHNGTDSYIDDAGTGDLRIRSNFLKIEKYTGETMASFNDDNAVTLFYNNSGRFATTSTGVSVTGIISDRDIPCLFNSNFQDLSGTTRRFISFNSTTINAASSPSVVNYLVMPYAGKVKKVYFKRVAGSSGTGFNITMYIYKNGANVANSGAIAWPSNHQASWEPSSSNTFAAGDTIAIAFQKTTSGVTLGHISVGLAVELTDYDI